VGSVVVFAAVETFVFAVN